ncbi:homoserine O-acetyltransferase MetX [Streptomyces sp. 900116325]
MKEFIPRGTRFVNLPSRFPIRGDGFLHGARIAYETFGQPNTRRDNVVLILTGLSADAHAASQPNDPSPGWWEAMVGPGKPIDTDRWYVICINSLGSCKGSTGPASIDPGTGDPYRLTFPELAIDDIADAAAHTVRALGVKRLACVIGTSMGGMTALALLTRHPELARTHISISAAVHALPFAIAVRSLQREAIISDPQWNDGRYDETTYPRRGMITARKLGMMTYRSAQEWDTRFGRNRIAEGQRTDQKHFDLQFDVEGYLESHAQRFVHNFDPNSYLYLSRCIDHFDLATSCGTTTEVALAAMQLEKALVIGVKTDILFPLHQQRRIAEGLGGANTDVQFLPLESPQGHDAFLVDIDSFGPPIAKFLSADW